MRIVYLGLIFFMFQSSASAEVLSFTGKAYQQGTQKLLYTERHELTLKNGELVKRSVTYSKPNGELIATKLNKYSGNDIMPSFDLRSESLGYKESAKALSKTWRVSFQENAKSKLVEKNVSNPNYQPVIDAGFDSFIKNKWNELVQPKDVSFSFLVPSRQMFVDFVLKPKKIENGILFLEMRLKNKMLSWLVSPIQLQYNVASQRLVRFSGLGNVPNGKGKNYTVDIYYSYS